MTLRWHFKILLSLVSIDFLDLNYEDNYVHIFNCNLKNNYPI